MASNTPQARAHRANQARARNYFKDLRLNPRYCKREDGTQIRFSTNRAMMRRYVAGARG